MLKRIFVSVFTIELPLFNPIFLKELIHEKADKKSVEKSIREWMNCY